jgi:hypothetical protein
MEQAATTDSLKTIEDAAKRKGRNRWVGMEAGDTEGPLEAMQRFRENRELESWR